MKLKTLAILATLAAPAWTGPDKTANRLDDEDKNTGKLSEAELTTLAHLRIAASRVVPASNAEKAACRAQCLGIDDPYWNARCSEKCGNLEDCS